LNNFNFIALGTYFFIYFFKDTEIIYAWSKKMILFNKKVLENQSNKLPEISFFNLKMG